MKILVIGAHGFVGRHLGRALGADGHELVEPAPPGTSGGVNIVDRADVARLFEQALPDAVVHLAAVSSVAQSHQEPERAFETNTLGVVNLLVAARRSCPKARVLLVSSSEVYGRSAPGTLLDETAPLVPLSPYAAAKAAGELAALQFHRSYGPDVVCARPFAHIGAGQAPNFVVPSFARQIAAIARREQPPVIKTGDLSPRRDFLHVADVVDAYRILLARGAAGAVYNVASGEGRTIQSLLDGMLELSGVHARSEVDPERLRPVEIPEQVGNSARLAALGWTPKREIGQALREVLAEHGALTAS